MARPQVVTDMQIWMLQTGRNDVRLAQEMNEKLAGVRAINERHIARWRKGLALPRYRELYAALEDISGGRVTLASFVHVKGPEDGKD